MYSERKQISDCLGQAGAGGRGKKEGFSGGLKNLLRVMMWSWFWWWFHRYIHVRIYQIMPFKHVQFIVCLLDLKKLFSKMYKNKLWWNLPLISEGIIVMSNLMVFTKSLLTKSLGFFQWFTKKYVCTNK